MLYVLIFIIISILLDYHYNFSNKLFDFPIDQKGRKIFLYIIYIFPVAVSTIALYLVDKLETKDVFTPIISFYATALTITFTVYSFYKTQEKTEKDRNEREKQRDKEREEREKKDFELREKELEAKRDYYRPIFVVEKDPNSYYDSKQITLLMKDEHLYLENIKYYNLQSYHGKEIGNLTSRQRIDYLTNYPYFITGQTLIGETILFGHYEKNKKVYKYLKPDKHPLDEPLSDAWGDYNTINHKKNSEFEKSFFNSTLDIRLELTKFYNNYFDVLFDLDEISSFLESALSMMEYHHRKIVNRTYNKEKQVKYNEILNMILINFINELSNNVKYMSINIDKYKDFESLLYKFIPNKLINKKKLYTHNIINLAYFLRIIRVNMYIKNGEDDMLSNTLKLLDGSFSFINVKPDLKFKSSKFRSFLKELEKVL